MMTSGWTRRAVLVLGCAVVACGVASPQAQAPGLAAVVQNEDQQEPQDCGPLLGVPVTPRQPLPGRLCGRLRLPEGVALPQTPGSLVVAWFRPEEQARFGQGKFLPIDLLVALVDRARVVRDVRTRTGDDLAYALDYPGGDAVVLAVAEFHQAFWRTVFGAGTGSLIGISDPARAETSSGRRADVALEVTPDRGTPPERCQGARLQLVTVEAPEVAGTIGNNPTRRLCVWLPDSYATSPGRRYPVVYLLPGLTGDHAAYLLRRPDLPTMAAELARAGVEEAILVGVDTSTRHGSTYFTDSAAGGAWARFARERMVPEIDRRYRTRANAAGRALVGHSTGGFNAVSLALRFPELFGAVGASAPDALDFESWLIGSDGRVRPRWLGWTRLEAAVGGLGQMVSYAAAWSPDAPAPALDFPFDLETGAVRAAKWSAWRAQSPLRLIEDPARQAAARRRLNGRLFITVGKRDDFSLYEPARRFAGRLSDLGIAHEFHATAGDHSSDQESGLKSALAFVLRAMQAR